MKSRILPVIFFSILLSLVFLSMHTLTVRAQGCTDATGAPIECPPSDSGSGSGGSGGNKRPTNTPTLVPPPTATSTPLPFKDNPTPTLTPPTPQPSNPGIQVTQQPGGIANPTGSGSDSGAASKGCSQADYDDTPGWLVECTAEFVIECASLGGDPTVVTHDEKNTSVYCSVDWGSPTINPIKLTVQHGDDVPPSKPASKFPPGSWLPWFAGLGGLLIGLLLPAIQKIREAAARSSGRQTKEHILLNKDDKPDEPQPLTPIWMPIEGVPGESKDQSPANDTPKIKNKEEDGGTEISTWDSRAIKINANGPFPPPPPPPPPTPPSNSAPAPEDSIGKNDDVISREDKDKR